MNIQTLLPYLIDWLGVTAVVMLAGASIRFKRKPIAFSGPKREAWAVAILFTIEFILAFLVYNHNLAPIVTTASDPNGQSLRFNAALYCLIPLAGILIIRRQPLQSAGWNSVNWKAALQLGFALVFLVFFVGGNFSTFFNGKPVNSGLLLFVAGSCLIEETIFRGYIQLRLASWAGQRIGLLLTALLSVVWQAPRWMAAPADLPFHLLLAAGQALVLGYVMRRSQHVLAPALYRAFSEWTFLIR